MSFPDLIQPSFFKSDINWFAEARKWGVAAEAAALVSQSIPTLVREWMASWNGQADQKPLFVKKSETLPFSVELLCSNNIFTVITHLNVTVGTGNQSTVKASHVYLSVDLAAGTLCNSTGTFVVDKRLRKNSSSDDLKALIREGELTRGFNSSPHIRHLLVPVSERAKGKGLLLEGIKYTLHDYYRYHHELDQNKIAQHILAGVMDLQSKNIAHRDLHMANCGLAFDNKWVLHDLGYATVIGTAQSQPPNLAVAPLDAITDWFHGREQKVFATYDLWGLGLILYELHYRKAPPFSQEPAIRALEDAFEKKDLEGLSRHKEMVDSFITTLPDSPLAPLITALLTAKPMEECLALASRLPSDSHDLQQPASAPGQTVTLASGYL